MLKLTGALACLLALVQPAAQAQQPVFPPVVRLIVPFPAGGGTDVLARALAPQLSARLRTNVVVENRVGGSTVIGTSAVAKGPTDGSMLLFTSTSLVTAVATMRKVPFDIDKDLVPVAMVSEGPMVVAVNAKSELKTPKDLVAAARSKPDTMTFGSSGAGALIHLTSELFNESANIKARHIPYKGATPAAVDVAGGLVDYLVVSRSAIAPLVDAGRLRMIGVTSSEASPAYPGLQPMSSVAPGFGVDIWIMVFAPAGMPANMQQVLAREINDISKSRQMRDVMDIEGAHPVELTASQLSARVQKDVATWRKLATTKNFVID